VAEKAIQDLSNMMRCMLADSNVPGIYWDFVIEHAALVNSMITPSISNKTKTIFEAVWDVIPNIDLVPPVGRSNFSRQSHHHCQTSNRIRCRALSFSAKR
jgi:hypothetical protein